MNQSWRLEAGGLIDRTRRLSFRFDGSKYEGFGGDTLASALLANGVRIVGRSFKLHRPRGLLGSWCEEPNAIMQIGRGAGSVPNLKATMVELFNGLEARSVNCWPSANCDVLAPLQWLSPVLPAGFYYKTFMWPSWRRFEPLIRRTAGLGIAPQAPDPDRYDERNEHCDVLVIGGGPAGLSAALAAARAGARVVLVDDRAVLGGALLSEEQPIDGMTSPTWVSRITKELCAVDRVRVLTRTTAFGFYDHNLVGLCERYEPAVSRGLRERLWRVRASQVVVAAGAIERPIVFPNNDAPGVMLASAAMSYAVQFAVRPGGRVVFVTSCDSAYEVAECLRGRGVTIVGMVDVRKDPGERALLAQHAGIPVLAGYGPERVVGARAVRGIDIKPLAAGARTWRSDRSQRLDCDLVCVSGGWTPTVHLFSQAGGRLQYSAERAALVPAAGPDTIHCVGAAAGSFALRDCLADGFAAGQEAARRTGAVTECGAPPQALPTQTAVSQFWSSPRNRSRKSWVDLQNDVTSSDLELAVRENFRSVEHVKRYTTTGMAVDQGKTSNMNALGMIAELTGRTIPEVGSTTFRPPYDPVTLGVLAGRHVGEFYHPLRRTPLDRWHTEHGAVSKDFGGWRRPAWYTERDLSRAECVKQEKRAARSLVSLFDGSPLGKLEVRGPDAATFLDRMYYNNMSSLATGRVRYGVMLNEHGVVVDDGVCMRLGEDFFLVSTTSAAAGRIFGTFEEWLQCEWPHLRVLITDVTSQWGSIAVAGPRARELVQRLEMDIDLSRETCPHLSIRSGMLKDIPVRVARVGFTGELSFEINTPSGYTPALWDSLLSYGVEWNARAIGVDALQELRIEKGFLHVGSDTDGRTIPADIGMGGVLSKKTQDFVGRRSLDRPDAKRADRLQFTGIAAEEPDVVLPIGAHIVASSKGRSESEGYVTSSCASETLARGVSLGLVRAAQSRMGESIHVYFEGRVWPARIVPPCQYDPKGQRLNA